MYYRFPLTQIYRADYNEKAWEFRAHNKRDLRAVSRWEKRSLKKSGSWRRDFYRELLREYSATAAISQHFSWMVTVKGKRILWIQIAETGSPATGEIYLTGHPVPLNDAKAALILWRRAVNFLKSLRVWTAYKVKLDISRDPEAQALEKLGFIKDGEYYVTLPPNGATASGEQEHEDGE